MLVCGESAGLFLRQTKAIYPVSLLQNHYHPGQNL